GRAVGRGGEAANGYERYLDAPDADPAKQADVTALLAELDAELGTLTVTIDVAGAELQVDGEWQPAGATRIVRVAPGAYDLVARKAGRPDREAGGGTPARRHG